MAVDVLGTLGGLHGDSAGLAVDADGPASTADLLGVTLAGHGALAVSELGRANEVVTTVALATVLSSSNGESLADTVGNALVVGHGAKVGQDIAGEDTADVVLVATSVGVSTNGSSSRVALGRNRSGGRSASSDCNGLSNGVDIGGAALGVVTSATGSGEGRSRGDRFDGLGGLAGVDNVAGGGRLAGGAGRLAGGRRGGLTGGRRGGLAGGSGSLARGSRSSSLAGRSGSGTTSGHSRGSTVAEAAEGVVTRELGESASNLLVNERGNGAVTAVQAVEETGALVHTRVTSIASVNDVLEEILVPTGHEVSVGTVSGNITVGEDEGLSSLVLGPAALVGLSVKVDLEEDVRGVNPARRAVLLAVTSIGGELHVVLVVGEAGGGVVARGEVEVHTERRVHAIASNIGETNTSALVVGVDHTSLGAVRADGV